ncbi:heavy metal-associated isoprenylated plant protein 47-like [Vitis riparia]|uniref:heavy metal-associated isoprenylated plant protein 47-like n=1 Tax=Vitis riparia TaxID=96939 RepID=UPI00155B2155|nr:heavy metal-associated isoprenylated plant protein 47-like [Vitis riparia]
MKQKVVLSVSLNYKKKCPCFIFGKLTSHSKALQIAAGSSGVESAAWQGDDKSKLEVSGDGIDLIALTEKLKKKIGYTSIVTVEEKKEEKKEETKEETKEEVPALVYHPMGFPHYLPPSNYGFCTVF